MKEEIKRKYEKLHELYEGMVGSLYPAVVYEQLMELRSLYMDGNPGWGDLTPVRQPSSSGHVI